MYQYVSFKELNNDFLLYITSISDTLVQAWYIHLFLLVLFQITTNTPCFIEISLKHKHWTWHFHGEFYSIIKGQTL